MPMQRRSDTGTPLVLAEQEVRDLVERMLVTSGRRVDLSKPSF
jgi:pilus assembly protein CpaF